MSNITKLRYHVHKILPLVYDDSLSYYELLSKVVRKLNEVIDASTVNENIIREEVDAWLEAHPEAYETTDYTMTDRVFEVVADMVDDESLEAGYYVRTCGYHAYGDGGGYFYKIKTAADQNAINIPLDSGLYAVMQDVGYYTPQMFGAVYDDNTVTVRQANTTALQNAVDFACAYEKPLILDGNIAIYDTVVANDHLHMYSKGFTISNDRYGSTQYALNDLFGYALITATDKKDLIVDGVRFEGSGHSIYDAKAVEIQGSTLTWVGWGVGLGLARCQDIEVKNCRFFKCGGYGHYSTSLGSWDYTGFGLWLSCCHDALITGNIVECGHYGIAVDRWFKDANDTYYNYNITITDNIVHTLSGDGIGYEGNGSNCNLVVSNNQGYNIRRRFFAGSRVWGAVISGNTFSNDPAIRKTPIEEYGLTGEGWNWDVSQLLYPAIRMTASFIRDVVIADNKITYATHGVQVAAGYDITVTGNVFDHIDGINVVLNGAADPYAVGYGNFVIADNSFLSGVCGVQCSNSNYETLDMENITITGNANKAGMLAVVLHAKDVVIKDNTGGAPSRLTSIENLRLSGYVVPTEDTELSVTAGDRLLYCTNVELNETAASGAYNMFLSRVINLTGHVKSLGAENAVFYVPAAENVTGLVSVDYIGEDEPTYWMSNLKNSFRLDIASAAKPTNIRAGAGSTWRPGIGAGVPASGAALLCALVSGAWVDLITAP